MKRIQLQVIQILCISIFWNCRDPWL